MQYSVRTKGHFEDEDRWVNMFTRVEPSNGQYPVIKCDAYSYPDGAKVDFQVETLGLWSGMMIITFYVTFYM